MLKNGMAGTNMHQRTSNRNRPFKTYKLNPNPVKFDAQGNPQAQGQSLNQNQGLQQDQLPNQALFDLDDASLLNLLNLLNQSESMNPNMMHGLGGMTSQGMSLGSTGNGMQGMSQGLSSMPSSSQAANMQMTSSSLSMPATSVGPNTSEIFGSSFLSGLGPQDPDINNFLTGMSPSLAMQQGMGQQGGMMSQQAGGMVHSGRDMSQSHRAMGQMSGNGPQMSSMSYSDMNIPSYTPHKIEKSDIFSSPPGTFGSASKMGEGYWNGNSVSSPDSPANTSTSAPYSPANSVNSLNDNDSGMEGDSSKSSKKRGHIVPDEQNDEAYWEKRRKNSESAKRSRVARRMKEEQVAKRVAVLEKEQLALKTNIGILENELHDLRNMLYNTPTAPPRPSCMPQ